MKITLCDKVLNGDIKSNDFKSKTDALELVKFWLEVKDFKKSVFVCFQSWEGQTENYRDEIQELFISHSLDQIELFTEKTIEEIDIINCNYSIFEFKSYEYAFKFCTDLTQGF